MKKYLLVVYLTKESNRKGIYEYKDTDTTDKTYSLKLVKYIDDFVHIWNPPIKWVDGGFKDTDGMEVVWGDSIEELDEQLMLIIL